MQTMRQSASTRAGEMKKGAWRSICRCLVRRLSRPTAAVTRLALCLGVVAPTSLGTGAAAAGVGGKLRADTSQPTVIHAWPMRTTYTGDTGVAHPADLTYSTKDRLLYVAGPGLASTTVAKITTGGDLR